MKKRIYGQCLLTYLVVNGTIRCEKVLHFNLGQKI